MATAQKNFFGKLFDLSFDHFITPSIAKVVLIVAIVLSAIGWVATTIAMFGVSVAAGLLTLLLGWVIALLLIVLARLSLELSVAVIQVAQNTRSLKQ